MKRLEEREWSCSMNMSQGKLKMGMNMNRRKNTGKENYVKKLRNEIKEIRKQIIKVYQIKLEDENKRMMNGERSRRRRRDRSRRRESKEKNGNVKEEADGEENEREGERLRIEEERKDVKEMEERDEKEQEEGEKEEKETERKEDIVKAEDRKEDKNTEVKDNEDKRGRERELNEKNRIINKGKEYEELVVQKKEDEKIQGRAIITNEESNKDKENEQVNGWIEKMLDEEENINVKDFIGKKRKEEADVVKEEENENRRKYQLMNDMKQNEDVAGEDDTEEDGNENRDDDDNEDENEDSEADNDNIDEENEDSDDEKMYKNKENNHRTAHFSDKATNEEAMPEFIQNDKNEKIQLQQYNVEEHEYKDTKYMNDILNDTFNKDYDIDVIANIVEMKMKQYTEFGGNDAKIDSIARTDDCRFGENKHGDHSYSFDKMMEQQMKMMSIDSTKDDKDAVEMDNDIAHKYEDIIDINKARDIQENDSQTIGAVYSEDLPAKSIMEQTKEDDHLVEKNGHSFTEHIENVRKDESSDNNPINDSAEQMEQANATNIVEKIPSESISILVRHGENETHQDSKFAAMEEVHESKTLQEPSTEKEKSGSILLNERTKEKAVMDTNNEVTNINIDINLIHPPPEHAEVNHMDNDKEINGETITMLEKETEDSVMVHEVIREIDGSHNFINDNAIIDTTEKNELKEKYDETNSLVDKQIHNDDEQKRSDVRAPNYLEKSENKNELSIMSELYIVERPEEDCHTTTPFFCNGEVAGKGDVLLDHTTGNECFNYQDEVTKTIAEENIDSVPLSDHVDNKETAEQEATHDAQMNEKT